MNKLKILGLLEEPDFMFGNILMTKRRVNKSRKDVICLTFCTYLNGTSVKYNAYSTTGFI